jgi:type IV secretory pathway TrbD component
VRWRSRRRGASAQAGDAFAANLAGSLAAILTLISLLLPWAVVLALVGLGVWMVARRRTPASRPSRPAPATPVSFEGGRKPCGRRRLT